ncbi:hypothetical protein ABT039_22570 [Streptomyces lasiicapitis]|uniref:hypothetical protein n=1 Tax=Streptomyces lasiicapitis TaxID=1923961 RepID=UPI003330DFFD
MNDFEPPAALIELERGAEEARGHLAGLDGDAYTTQWRRWRKAAAKFQAAVTEHAKRDDVPVSRCELEQAVKWAVRHAPADPAE